MNIQKYIHHQAEASLEQNIHTVRVLIIIVLGDFHTSELSENVNMKMCDLRANEKPQSKFHWRGQHTLNIHSRHKVMDILTSRLLD